MQTTPASPTPHFDGSHFSNVPATHEKTFFDFLRWIFNRQSAPIPAKTAEITSAKPKPVLSDDIVVTAVGHSTFLIQSLGINILTDPIWSERCSPVSFLGPKRFLKPGIDFDDLPKVDVVVISHNHYDHLDLPTLKRLNDRDRPLFIVPLKNRELLTSEGIISVVEQDWWDKTTFKDVTITAVPAQHWSGRWVFDRNQTLWSGFVISFKEKNVFFAGDTGLGPHFLKIKQEFHDFAIALLPIGAFLPRWFMKDHHLSPEDALEVANILQAKMTIPMHYGLFALGDDGIDKAIVEFKALAAQNKKEIAVAMPGEVLTLKADAASAHAVVVEK